MQILKAYANAGAGDGQGYGFIPTRGSGSAESKARPSRGGDSVSLSSEAREALEAGGNAPINFGHQDATYDQYGNVTRQIDSLRGDLRKLAAHFMATPGATGMLGKVNSAQSQLASIEATV